MLAVITFVGWALLGCAGDTWCPEEPYVPKGPVIESACDCEDGAPFICLDLTCDGEYGAKTCEDPEVLREWYARECLLCYPGYVDDIGGFQCSKA